MKKILLCLAIIIGLFTITGCSNNNKETVFVKDEKFRTLIFQISQ